MISSPEPNKAIPKSDSDGYSQYGTATLNDQSPQQETVDNNNLEKNLIRDGRQTEPQEVPHRRWRGISLKTKATALAITLGTLPVIAIGSTAYYFANQSVVKQIKQEKQYRANEIADKVNRFMFDRYGDVQVLAKLPILANPKLRAVATIEDKEAALNIFIDTYKVYNSIAAIDLNGNVIAQSREAALPNLSDRDYFQAVIKTDRPFISRPRIDKITGIVSIFFSAPIKDTVTGKTIAVIRTRMPVKFIDEAIKNFQVDGDDYHLINSGKFFVASEKELLGDEAQKDMPIFSQLKAAKKADTRLAFESSGNIEELIAYKPLGKLEGLPNLDWDVILATNTEVAFAPQRQLLLTLVLGTILTAAIVSLIAAALANQATRPVLTAADAVGKLGQGELDTRIAVEGEDELATLGSNINLMAGQLQSLIKSQADEAKLAQLTKDITLRIGQSLNSTDILNTAVEAIRLALKTDRVVVYSFNEKWQGIVIAESVGDGWQEALGAEIDDPCFAQDYVEPYRQGRIQAIENIYEAGLTECYIKQLEQFAVKANLVAPIIQNKELLGLLIAHQCSEPRAWRQAEIDLFAQLATQVGFALDRADLLEQQRTAKEQLQQRALELLMEVDPISRGDLTIRANVTEDEIGTVADSYNATIGSLRKIVTQVQTAATQVAATTNSSESSVQELSTEALRQAEEIALALDRIQEMSNSIQAVGTNAKQAEAAVQQATQTVEAGDAAMNRTVNGMLAIQETVAETSTKVKRLGEASQKISKVVKLISSFADQTNLLALNAAIEAARAGEEGRGFAVVADEVQSLALQSAQATAEIESLVADIQTETKEVVAAMEAGTLQVAEGTLLVDETRQSLNQITTVSTQISALVSAIAQASVTQSQVSESVSQTMTDVAAIAQHNSTEATLVSASFKELLAVAQQLQASAGQFKVS